jgi:Flp pilus assembly protein TadB
VTSIDFPFSNDLHPPFSRSIADAPQRREMTMLGIQRKILGVVAVLAAVALLAMGLGVSGMRSYHDRVAKMTRTSERALLGEQMDKLVTAVVMESRGTYMSTENSDAEKYSAALLKSLSSLREKTAGLRAVDV